MEYAEIKQAMKDLTTEQQIKVAILCAKKVCKDEKWSLWADKWLSGEDRRRASAYAAAASADAAYATYAAYAADAVASADAVYAGASAHAVYGATAYGTINILKIINEVKASN